MLAARLILPATLMLAALVAPALARAGDGVEPRVPVEWQPEPACMTVVDRTVDAKLSFNYTMLYESTEVTADEVVDSRRHQFLGFCRGHSRQLPLPVWLTEVDIAAAAAKQLIDPAMVDPEDVFETSAEWKDCWFRITGDDERRPITFAEAMKPVVWDTSLLPAGAYVIAGYTWHPPFNTWSERSGVVKVMDDPDPAKNPPAMALSNGEEIKFGDEVLTLTGCLDAMDGSTISGFWSLTTGDTLDWQMFASDVPVSGPDFQLDFIPPLESWGEQITMKVEVTDPMDRRFTAHLGTLATILPPLADTGGCQDGGSAFINDPGCGTSGDPTSGTGDSAASDGLTTSPDGNTGASSSAGPETGPEEQPGAERGCECGLDGSAGGAPSALLLALTLLLGRGRRARRASRVHASI